ncbi:hypothetical protein [Streptomyces sp. NPDC001816]|uniref:hypothetical protein n=1 Tax=Streptomyces sp. NPDC001816 TaxID=3364612 RepID=UPI00367CEA08
MASAESMGSAGATGEAEVYPPRSALTDIAEQTVLHAGSAPLPPADVLSAAQPHPESSTLATAKQSAADAATTAAQESVLTQPTDRQDAPLSAEQAMRLRVHRRRFRARLGEFRRRRVLVPYGENGAALTVETHAARWLLAFTDEAALARYARARGEGDRVWRYRTVWGAAVLDAGVPAVAEAGLPCGVLVDAGDGERGMVLPPVVGIVPEAVAVDRPGNDGGPESGTGTRVRGVQDMDSGAET